MSRYRTVHDSHSGSCRARYSRARDSRARGGGWRDALPTGRAVSDASACTRVPHAVYDLLEELHMATEFRKGRIWRAFDKFMVHEAWDRTAGLPISHSRYG